MKSKSQFKDEIRILGIDDAPFHKSDKNCLVVATIFRGGTFMDGLLSCKVQVDGNDATEKLIQLVEKTRHFPQLKSIMLDGIALAGFNVIDIQKLSEKTKLPVIVLIRKKPDLEKIKTALSNLPDGQEKLKLIKKAGEIFPVSLPEGKVYIQIAGLSSREAEKIVKLAATRSLIPEPIRIAHIVASGIVLGESRGRA